MSIWHTQAVLTAATAALEADPDSAGATDALVEVRDDTGAAHTAAAHLHRSGDGWDLVRLYTADHAAPGAPAVVVVGVWGDAAP